MSEVATDGMLPPQVQLARVVAGLGDYLAANWSTVLTDERWADVAAALERLAVPGAVVGVAGELGDAESVRLADLLLARWARIGEAALAPAAAIVGPAVGSPAAELTVLVDGLLAGWTATWHGPVEPVDASGAIVRLLADAPVAGRVSVRVFGRTDDGHRTILTAEALLPGDLSEGPHQPGGPGAAD
jgi:hypothetical protein